MTQGCSCHGQGNGFSQSAVGLLERPRYSPGLILEDSDLTAAVDYTRELNRLLFRSLFGCGVVCGLTVKVEAHCGLTATVSPGLALDGCGDPLQLTRPVEIKLSSKDGDPSNGDCKDYWVIACSGEKSCRPRAIACDSDDLQEHNQATRVISTVEIGVMTKWPECGCGCRHPDPKQLADLDGYAGDLLKAQASAKEWDCCADPNGCQKDHRTRIGCPEDCGCGTACAFGCCVLLAWIHWFPGRRDGNNQTPAGWSVLHNGVRRFVRPALLPDPLIEKRSQQSGTIEMGPRMWTAMPDFVIEQPTQGNPQPPTAGKAEAGKDSPPKAAAKAAAGKSAGQG